MRFVILSLVIISLSSTSFASIMRIIKDDAKQFYQIYDVQPVEDIYHRYIKQASGELFCAQVSESGILSYQCEFICTDKTVPVQIKGSLAETVYKKFEAVEQTLGSNTKAKKASGTLQCTNRKGLNDKQIYWCILEK